MDRPPTNIGDAATVLEALLHRMASPVGAIANFAHVLPEDELGSRAGILEASARARHLIEGGRRWLRAMEAGSGAVQATGADLAAALRRCDPDGICLTYASDPQPLLALPQGALECIIEEVLQNAEAAAAPERARVRTLATEEAEGVTLRFEDSGPGWGPRAPEEMFAHFNTGSAESASAGVGLAIVAALAERYGGRAWGASAEAGGAVIFVRLPTRKTEEQTQ